MDWDDFRAVSIFVFSVMAAVGGVTLVLAGLNTIISSIGLWNIPSIMSGFMIAFPGAQIQLIAGLTALALGLYYGWSYRSVDAVGENRLKIAGALVAIPVVLGASAVLALPEHDLGEDEQVAAESFNEMGAELGEALIEREDDRENIVYSPMSIGFAFSMVYAGSEGESREELEEFLNVEVDEEVFHESNREILRSLENPEPDYTYHRMLGLANEVETNLANGIWVDAGTSYRRDYADRMDEYYEAEVRERVFNDETEDEINSWVSDETEGMIDEIVDDLGPQDAMALMNAIYFYGDWMEEFDEEDTETDDFQLRDGSTVEVEMMEQTEESFKYMDEGEAQDVPEAEFFQAVRLPYGETGRFGMYVMLPEDIEEFVQEFDQEKFDDIQEEMSETEIDLYMPKFEASHDIELDEVMREQMGIEQIFRSSDDWGRMSREVKSVDRAAHDAKIEVDEEGTEAAAATKVVMIDSAEMRPVMRVDRPFMFAIADEETGGILFQGIIQDPS